MSHEHLADGRGDYPWTHQAHPFNASYPTLGVTPITYGALRKALAKVWQRAIDQNCECDTVKSARLEAKAEVCEELAAALGIGSLRGVVEE